jgi:hypothetical protein
VAIRSPRRMGSVNQHLKFYVGNFPAVYFNQPDLNLKPGLSADLIYRIDLNIWNGRSDLQLIVKDLQFL